MKKIIKFLTLILALSSVGIVLTACGSSTPKADYTEVKAEKALNAGKDIKGKNVSIEVAKLEPRSAFGYNIEAGKHLNFVSEENPDVKVGDKLIVKVKKVKSVIGSFVINYDLIHKTKGKKISNNKKKVATSKNKKSSSVKPDPNANKRTWTYKDNVFDAGIETYKFTKAEIRDSAQSGQKALVLYCDITNNSTSKPDPSLVTLVMTASQKTDTAEKQLTNAVSLKSDESTNTSLEKYENALYDKLLPGKTTHAVIIYDLVNDNPVRVDFENADSEVIGSKTYNLKKLKYIKSNNSSVIDADANQNDNSYSSSSYSQKEAPVKTNTQTKQTSAPAQTSNNKKESTTSSEPKDTDMVSIGNGSYSQYNDPNSQTDTPKEEHDLEEYVKAHQNGYDD